MKDIEINSLLKASDFKQGHPECTLEKRDIAPNGIETKLISRHERLKLDLYFSFYTKIC